MGWILSIAGVLGVGGLGAAAYFLGPAALLGFGKSALGFLAKIPWQAYAIAALAALIAFLIISRSHWISRSHNDEAQLALICQATRGAANNPKLDCKLAAAQIHELGNSIKNLRDSLDHQNAAVAALGAKTAEQQKAAAEAEKKAARRAEAAQSVAERLRESAAHAPAPGAPCTPSKTLQEQWQ